MPAIGVVYSICINGQLYRSCLLDVYLIGRVVTCTEKKSINGKEFCSFGAHHATYPLPYFTVAAAIGMQRSEVDTFCKRLDKVMAKVCSSDS